MKQSKCLENDLLEIFEVHIYFPSKDEKQISTFGPVSRNGGGVVDREVDYA
ncbi:MAG TPA: hypothetical protein VF571_16630 [Pyrinomonadaceae bacterium]|jgi:hypothetical protein